EPPTPGDADRTFARLSWQTVKHSEKAENGAPQPLTSGFAAHAPQLTAKSAWIGFVLAGNLESRDEDVEAFGRRGPVRGRVGAEPGERASPPSPMAQHPLCQLLRLCALVPTALSHQLQAQLRPRLRTRHVCLLRRAGHQPLLSGLGRLSRAGP